MWPDVVRGVSHKSRELLSFGTAQEVTCECSQVKVPMKWSTTLSTFCDSIFAKEEPAWHQAAHTANKDCLQKWDLSLARERGTEWTIAKSDARGSK